VSFEYIVFIYTHLHTCVYRYVLQVFDIYLMTDTACSVIWTWTRLIHLTAECRYLFASYKDYRQPRNDANFHGRVVLPVERIAIWTVSNTLNCIGVDNIYYIKSTVWYFSIIPIGFDRCIIYNILSYNELWLTRFFDSNAQKLLLLTIIIIIIITRRFKGAKFRLRLSATLAILAWIEKTTTLDPGQMQNNKRGIMYISMRLVYAHLTFRDFRRITRIRVSSAKAQKPSRLMNSVHAPSTVQGLRDFWYRTLVFGRKRL